MSNPLLRVRDLRVEFGAHAVVRGVSFELAAGETLGLVGESGSGKSTLARAILRLLKAAQGSVELLGLDLLKCPAATLREQRRSLQMVFQDPLASLNPRMTVGEAIAEPLQIFEPGSSATSRLRVSAMLERVGLGANIAGRYPHEFSGGQCQRIAIARAMMLGPKLLICDEIVSSLDVSIQGQILNLLLDLQRETGMALLFISHNLAVVRHLSHRVLVMYLGKLVEVAPCDALFAAPIHPYTRALLAAVPHIAPDGVGAAAAALRGAPTTTVALAAPTLPAALAEPTMTARLMASGCAFRDRCPYALPMCETSEPPLLEVAPGHWAACHEAPRMKRPSGSGLRKQNRQR